MISWTMGDVDPRLRFKDDFTSWVISVGKTEESAKRDARVKTSDTAAPTMVPTVATSSEVDISEKKWKFSLRNPTVVEDLLYFCGKTAYQTEYFFEILSKNKMLRLWISKIQIWIWLEESTQSVDFMDSWSVFAFAQKNAPTNFIFSSSSEASTYFQI